MSVPYIFGGGASPADNFSGTIILPANGGSIVVPLYLVASFLPQTITCRTTDISGSHTLEVALYTDPALRLIISGSFTFTASAAAVRTGVFTTAPANIASGVIWLVCRNAGAASTTLSTVAVGGLGGNYAATQTLGSSLGASVPASGWIPTASLPLVRVDGSIDAVGGATLN